MGKIDFVKVLSYVADNTQNNLTYKKIGDFMIQALSAANQGMNTAATQQTQSAQRIANPKNPGEGNLAKEMVKQIETENNFSANAAVAKTANDMLGSVVDLVG